MEISLGAHQYGKSENRIVRIYRDSARHELVDLSVSTSLRGDFRDAHVTGDQAALLPTDSQKNAAFAYAKLHGVSSPEDYAIALGRHFLETVANADSAQVQVEQYPWQRIVVNGREHDHAFVRRGDQIRTTAVRVSGRAEQQRIWVISGVKELTLLKSGGSEFQGFLKDRFTTLAETDDRIMATSLLARWRYDGAARDWNASYDAIVNSLLETFATKYSHALQETLYAIGERVLEDHADVAEIKLSAPNKHHFLYDLAQFGIANDNEVFIAADRPYGLIEASVVRDEAEPPGDAWLALPAFA